MAKQHLQLALMANLDADPEPEINVTPIDQELPTLLANKVNLALNLADLSDSEPGDGEFDFVTDINYPIKKLLNWYPWDHVIKLPLKGTLRIVQKD
jgi:hypothetical protein